MASVSSVTGTLQPKDGPMVWIDCEMTGLDHHNDKVLEIAVIVTNGELEPVDQGISYVIKTDKRILDNMHEWCVNQHGKSGLTDACLKSPHTKEFVQDAVLQYIKKWVPVEKSAVLCGNSVHADRYFLVEEMPQIINYLHYRIVDVSSIKELSRRWYPSYKIPLLYESDHRALEDIRGSIKELKHYREQLFVKNTPVAVASSSSQPMNTRPLKKRIGSIFRY